MRTWRVTPLTPLFFCACLALTPCADLLAQSPGLPPGGEAAARVIDRPSIEAAVRFLADDLLEGRGPASQGDRLARLYLASRLQGLGYEPPFPGDGWEQRFPMVGITAEVPAHWTFSRGDKHLSLAFWDEFIASSGIQSEEARIGGAELVFVGYGIQAPEYDWDDYKGVDLSGKVLLMLNNDPDWDPELFQGNTRLYYGRWDYKYESAARQGASGAIIIHTTPSAGYPFQVVQTSWTGEQFELPAGDEKRTPVQAWVTQEAARQLALLAGEDLDRLVESARSRDFRPVPLGITTSLVLENRLRHVESANVGGLLRGSDPELADEAVVFTAHHDHLGVGKADAAGDTIYNGARDNASGMAQMLGVAEAFARLPEPPRRSVLILFVGAEEQGLLGSEFYARNPTFPPGRIAANVNLDGGNIWGTTTDVSYIGYGKSSLDGVVENLAEWQGRQVFGDQFPDRGHFYRSDQFNFARIGVPAIYLDQGSRFTGKPDGWGEERIEAWEAENYHQPSDELSADWNFDGMIQDARLAFLAGLAIAQADELPRWNPGDEFEAARLQALEGLND